MPNKPFPGGWNYRPGGPAQSRLVVPSPERLIPKIIVRGFVPSSPDGLILSVIEGQQTVSASPPATPPESRLSASGHPSASAVDPPVRKVPAGEASLLLTSRADWPQRRHCLGYDTPHASSVSSPPTSTPLKPLPEDAVATPAPAAVHNKAARTDTRPSPRRSGRTTTVRQRIGRVESKRIAKKVGVQLPESSRMRKNDKWSEIDPSPPFGSERSLPTAFKSPSISHTSSSSGASSRGDASSGSTDPDIAALISRAMRTPGTSLDNSITFEHEAPLVQTTVTAIEELTCQADKAESAHAALLNRAATLRKAVYARSTGKSSGNVAKEPKEKPKAVKGVRLLEGDTARKVVKQTKKHGKVKSAERHDIDIESLEKLLRDSERIRRESEAACRGRRVQRRLEPIVARPVRA